MRERISPVLLCILLLLLSGCLDPSIIQVDSDGSPHSSIPGTPSQVIQTSLNTTNADNVQEFQSSGPDFYHPSTIFIFSRQGAGNILGESVFIPTELPSGYAYSTGYLTLEGLVSLRITNDSNSIRYLQVRPLRPISGTLTGISEQVTFNGTEGQCTIEGDKRQLFWSDSTHDFYLIGCMSCDEFIRMAASISPLTNETLETVPWEEPQYYLSRRMAGSSSTGGCTTGTLPSITPTTPRIR